MINESRRAQRRNVHESVVVIDTMIEQAIGRVGNISESGMLLVASAPLCASSYSAEPLSSAFDGMQPILRQTPPSVSRFSMHATLSPCCAARIAAT